MRALFPGIGDPAHKLDLDSVRCLAGCHACAIANPEDMRVDGNGRVSKGLVQHHIRCFPANAGKRLKRGAIIRHEAAMRLQQHFRQPVNILRLGVEQADGADVMGNAVNA